MPNPIISKLLDIKINLLLLVSCCLFLFFSFAYTDQAISQMLATSKPIFHQIISFTNWGDQHRYFLIFIFLITFLLFFISQLQNKNQSLTFALIISTIISFSYPVTSKDIFSYLYAAKMVTQYHANPYATKPEVFANTDLWLGFTQWTNSTYAYPPLSLLYSLIPTIIFGTNRFLLLFFSYKILNLLIFCLTGYLLFKKIKSNFVYSSWFFNPFLILEFLVNGHNDLLMVSLCLLAFAYSSLPLLVLSIFTKIASFIAIPGLIFIKNRQKILKITLFVLLFFLISDVRAIQSWYYTWIFMFLPFIKLKPLSIRLIYFYCFLLIISYTSYLYSRTWTSSLPLISFLTTHPFWFPLLLLYFEIPISNLTRQLSQKTSNNQQKQSKH